MADFLWKPESERDGNLVILNNDAGNVGLVDNNSGQVVAVGQDFGASNDREHTVRFNQPGSAFSNVTAVNLDTGEAISGSIGNGAQRFQGATGFELTASSGPGGSRGAPQADIGGIVFNPVNFNTIETPRIPFVDFQRVDPFEVAGRARDFNRDSVLENFQLGRDITRRNLDFARDVLPDINTFNQEERLRLLNLAVPQQQEFLDTGLRNAQSFLEGRLPDTVEDRAFELSARNRAIEGVGLAGGGIGSPFGQSLSNLLSIQQRLNLQNLGATQGSNFLAQAAQLRFADPQRLTFNPQEIFAAAEILNRGSTLTPGQAIQTEVGQNQFAANLEQQVNLSQAQLQSATDQFNAQGLFQADTFNSTGAFNAAVTQANFGLQNEILDFNVEQARQNAERQAAADAATIAQAQGNASQQQQSGNIGSVISGIGNIAGAAGGIIDAVGDIITPAPPPTTTPAPTQAPAPQQAPQQQAGTFEAIGSVVDTISGLFTRSAPPTELVGAAPVSTAPAAAPNSTSVINNPVVNDSGFSFDARRGELVHNNDFDLGLSVGEAQAFEAAQLNVTPRQARIALTSPSGINTQQLQAHKTARATTPELVAPQNLRPSQVTFPDGATGLNNDRSISEASSIQSPVPIAAVSNQIGTEVDFANETKRVVNQFNTPSLLPNPIRGEVPPVSTTPVVTPAFTRPISRGETSLPSLGSKTLDTILNTELVNPSVDLFPVSESDGQPVISPDFAINWIAERVG